MTLLTILQLALIVYVPGAVLFRAPVLDPARRAMLPAEERAFWAVLISVALACMLTVALAAADLYTFGRLLAIEAGHRRRRDRAVARGAALQGAGGARRPGGARSGGSGRDEPVAPRPTRRVHHRRQGSRRLRQRRASRSRSAARSSSAIRSSPSVPPAFARDLFFPSHQQSTYYSVAVHGVLHHRPRHRRGRRASSRTCSRRRLRSAYGVDGLTGRAAARWRLGDPRRCSRSISPARGCSGAAPRRPAARCSRSTSIEVWFARYPNAEVVMQALLFAALLAERARARGRRPVLRARSPASLLGAAALPALRRGPRASPASSARAGARPRRRTARAWTASSRRCAVAGGAPRSYLLGPDARVHRCCRSCSSPTCRGGRWPRSPPRGVAGAAARSSAPRALDVARRLLRVCRRRC